VHIFGVLQNLSNPEPKGRRSVITDLLNGCTKVLMYHGTDHAAQWTFRDAAETKKEEK
jgi:hypothetical protein